MTKKLRPHQEKAISQIREAWRSGARRPLLQLATGGGKTITAVELARPFIGRGERVCFVAPLTTLIEQTANVFRAQGFTRVGFWSGGYPAPKDDNVVVIASAQTIARRGPPPGVKLAIVDECHVRHERVERWITGLDAPLTVGLSATPWSAGLGRTFDRLIKPVSMRDLLRDGLLVPARVYAPSTFDVSKVRVVAGEYDQRQLARAVDNGALVGDVVRSWQRLGEGRATICFATNLQHADHIAHQFNSQGIASVVVDADTPADRREEIRKRLAAGAIKIVVNVGVLTAGFDLPVVSCIICARPTRSAIFHVQTLGRGLRPAPGKTDCIVLDHAGNSLRLGLIEDIDRPGLDRGDGTRREQGADPGVRRCATCSRVKKPSDRCSKCPAPALPVTAPGRLEAIDHVAKVRERAAQVAFLGGMKWLAEERGYAPGWAEMRFKKRFGFWPDNLDAPPRSPNDEVLMWFHRWRHAMRERMRERA